VWSTSGIGAQRPARHFAGNPLNFPAPEAIMRMNAGRGGRPARTNEWMPTSRHQGQPQWRRTTKWTPARTGAKVPGSRMTVHVLGARAFSDSNFPRHRASRRSHSGSWPSFNDWAARLLSQFAFNLPARVANLPDGPLYPFLALACFLGFVPDFIVLTACNTSAILRAASACPCHLMCFLPGAFRFSTSLEKPLRASQGLLNGNTERKRRPGASPSDPNNAALFISFRVRSRQKVNEQHDHHNRD